MCDYSQYDDLPAWWNEIEHLLPHVGTAQEPRYFRVMTAAYGKVLWTSPEHYENTHGVQLHPRVKARWHAQAAARPHHASCPGT